MYSLGRLTGAVLNSEQVNNLTIVYKKFYPDLEFSTCVFPNIFMKCTSITVGSEIFGKYNLAIMRTSIIMANWNNRDSKIIDNNRSNFDV